MSPEAKLQRIIKRTERILPGRPAPEGESDARWQAIMLIEEHVPEQPELVWAFTLKWGKHPQEDLRSAVAVLLLERLLEHHYSLIVPRVEVAASKSKRFRDTLARCYWIGEAAWPPNARRLDRLAGVKRQRIRPQRPPKRRAR